MTPNASGKAAVSRHAAQTVAQPLRIKLLRQLQFLRPQRPLRYTERRANAETLRSSVASAVESKTGQRIEEQHDSRSDSTHRPTFVTVLSSR